MQLTIRMLILCSLITLLFAAYQLRDLYVFDPNVSTWTLLNSQGQAMPGAREGAGFASLGGLLYLHGGFSGSIGLMLYGESASTGWCCVGLYLNTNGICSLCG